MVEASQDQLIILLTVGTIGTLVLAVFITFFFFTYQSRMVKVNQEKLKREIEFQQEMSFAQLESQEQERIRIASDLHDSLGSLLWSAKVNATFIERSVPLNVEANESHLELMLALDASITLVKRIAWELTPEAFQHVGLSEALSSLCRGLDKKQMKVLFSQNGEVLWKDHNAMQVYRIAQELVSNSIKHSKAKTLQVHLDWHPQNLILKVEDNGIGYDLENKRKGVGLWNIEQRAAKLKAEITIGKTPPEAGTHVTLKIPLTHDE